MSRYIIKNKEVFNPNKKTIIFFMIDTTISKNIYEVTSRYVLNTLKILLKDFNILLISRSTGIGWIEHALNHDVLNKCMLFCFDANEKKYYNLSAEEQPSEEKVKYIIGAINEFEANEPHIINSLVGTITTHCVIPSLDLKYEILSYGDDILLQQQIKSSNGYIDRMKKHKLFSHTAYINKPIGFAYEFEWYLMEHYPNIFHYVFSHDSSSTWLHFTKQYNPFTKNVKCFFYEKQFLENREFERFPMCEMQDLLNSEIHTKEYYENILNNKTNQFMFGGLFPYKVSQRVNSWYKYFNDLRLGTIRTQVDGSTKIDSSKFHKDVKFTEGIAAKLNNDIKNHPLTTNTLPYDEYNKDLQNTMFTIMLQCYYGKYDNLTFRCQATLYNGSIPLISEEYDEHNFQIPKKFRDKLLVKNHKDIEEKCKYYSEHYDEYKELFYEMYDYYIKPFYFDESYYENEFKTNLFKEIYKEYV